MDKKDILNLLNNLHQEEEIKIPEKHDKILLVDGLNLFFRNFAMMNMVNPDGTHIGGLGGSLRSLGALIKQFRPTQIYMIFDGPGSTANRKNIISEYKGGRNQHRITNWDAFDNLEEEDDAKINQIVRLIQYLKLLPVKTISFPKVEADDIIAVLSKYLSEKYNSKCTIISSDKDFLQLINENIVVYRPIERKVYNMTAMEIPPHNFILYKTLIGDNSDNLPGIKGVGQKTLLKHFPEILTQNLSLNNIFEISESKLGKHIIYARVLESKNRLKDSYRIMDLSKPMISEEEKQIVYKISEQPIPPLNIETFMSMYNEDKMGGMIRNLEIWLKENFGYLEKY